MKKLILSIILVCFLAIPVYAFNPLVVCGGGVAASEEPEISGFSTSAPTSDPDGNSISIDGTLRACRFTSPAGSNKITAIGFYQAGASNSAAAYEMAVYDNSGTSPGTIISGSSIQTGQSTTASTVGWYWYTGLSWNVVAETVYWVGIGSADVANANYIDRVAFAGSRHGYEADAAGTLDSTWNSFSATENDVAYAVVIIYEPQ